MSYDTWVAAQSPQPLTRLKVDLLTGTTAVDTGSLASNATVEGNVTLGQTSLRTDGVGTSIDLVDATGKLNQGHVAGYSSVVTSGITVFCGREQA